MPIYEYRCESCAQELEKIQKFSDPPLTDCPACGKAALKKLVSASSFRLKGSGWYETDFKNKKKPGENTGKPDSEGKSSDSKSESKSDSAPGSSGSKSADSSARSSDTASGSGNKASSD